MCADYCWQCKVNILLSNFSNAFSKYTKLQLYVCCATLSKHCLPQPNRPELESLIVRFPWDTA